jgi:hypothetical protein
MNRAKAIRAVKDWIIRHFPRVVMAYGQFRHDWQYVDPLEKHGYKKDYSFRYGEKFVKGTHEKSHGARDDPLPIGGDCALLRGDEHETE